MHIEPKMKTRIGNREEFVYNGLTKDKWIELLDLFIGDVPEPYKKSAIITPYASHDNEVYLGVQWRSPETNEEMEGARQRQMFIEAQEKEQLRKLMEKYPDAKD